MLVAVSDAAWPARRAERNAGLRGGGIEFQRGLVGDVAGQRMLAEKGRYPGRPGMRLKYPEMDVSGRKINLLFLRPEDEEDLGKKYLRLRERFLLAR